MTRNRIQRAMQRTAVAAAFLVAGAPAALAGSATLPPDAVIVEHEGIGTKLVRRPVVPDRRELRVDVWTDAGHGGRVHPGEDVIVRFEVNRDAWVAVYDIDTRGRRTLLFPTRFGDSGRVRGGETMSLPERGAGYRLMATGPSGIERIVVLAAERPLVDRHGRWIGDGSGRDLEELLGTDGEFIGEFRPLYPRSDLELTRVAPSPRETRVELAGHTVAPKLVPVPVRPRGIARAETWFRVTAGWRRW